MYVLRPIKVKYGEYFSFRQTNIIRLLLISFLLGVCISVLVYFTECLNTDFLRYMAIYTFLPLGIPFFFLEGGDFLI